MYIEFSNCRGVQKFVDTKIVRRNSIGSNLVSANSYTPYFLIDFRRLDAYNLRVIFCIRL